jgi:hypothetical protein
MSPRARFAFAAAILIFTAVFLLIIDPGVSHAISSTPYVAMLVGTAFAIDPLDRVMTLAEWRAKNRISASTERRLRKAGLGPKLIHISAGQLGIRVRDDIEWMERGGASGAPVQSADHVPLARANVGRNTTKATAASMAKRAKRKATGPAPVITEVSPIAAEEATPVT